jgi:hypothetical protein
MNDERIHQILREGDPFAEEPGLSPEEIREMRRTVLNAIPDHPERRFRLLPALALAGVAAVAVLIAVLILRQNPEGTPKPAPPRMAAAPVPIPPPSAPAADLVPREETRTVQPRPHRRRAVTRRPRTEDAVASLEGPKEPEETAVREIQFTTPGGTRILWTVAPGKASY